MGGQSPAFYAQARGCRWRRLALALNRAQTNDTGVSGESGPFEPDAFLPIQLEFRQILAESEPPRLTFRNPVAAEAVVE